MESLYVTLYPSATTLVNAQLLHVHLDSWDVRLSNPIESNTTIEATFWLSPAPVNCRVRIVHANEDPITGELRAQFYTVDMPAADRRRALVALYGDVRLRNVS